MSETELIRKSRLETQARLLNLEERVEELEKDPEEHGPFPCPACMNERA